MTCRDVCLGNAAGQPGNDFADGTVSQTMKFLKTLFLTVSLAAGVGLLGACGGAGEPLPTPSKHVSATPIPRSTSNPSPSETLSPSNTLPWWSPRPSRQSW